MCYVKLMIIYWYILQQILIPLFFGVGNLRVPKEYDYYVLIASVNNTLIDAISNILFRFLLPVKDITERPNKFLRLHRSLCQYVW